VYREGPVTRRLYLTYLSDALEHDSLIASLLLNDAVTFLPDAIQRVTLWSDCGPHYRSYQFVYWALVALPRKLHRKYEHPVEVRLNFFCEQHGKGPNDAHFAVVKGWIHQYCFRGGVVSTLTDAKQAMDEGAAAAMELHPPPEGPSYIQKVVDVDALGAKPPAVTELADTGKDPNNFRISKTYCLTSKYIPDKYRPPADKQQATLVYDYEIQNRVFSDCLVGTPVSARQGYLRVESTGLAADRRHWKIGKRDNKPELEPFAADKLRRRMEAQIHLVPAKMLTKRRDTMATRSRRAAASKVQKNLKGRRVTAVVSAKHKLAAEMAKAH
jgi:hypothetical protein